MLQHLAQGMTMHVTPPPYGSVVLSKESKKETSLIYTVIGYNTDGSVDVITLIFILILNPIHGIPLPKYDLCDLIIQRMI